MAKQLIQRFDEYHILYRDEATGIARVEDTHLGCSHSAHSNIDRTGSVRGMKAKGYWRKSDRTARAFGFIYNLDTLIVGDEYDRIAAAACRCIACREREGNGQ
jgi:hypothetical protein